MKEIVEKKRCCGCAACYNACPVNAIIMEADEEGFAYPRIQDHCIGCGKCRKVCPVLECEEENICVQHGYTVQNRDAEILRESTSGGAFTAIAEYVLENGGIVYGASLDEGLSVRHISAESRDELYKFRGSKYVQSEIGKTFAEAKGELEADRLVCFSGTPCQIEGLIRFLGKKYDNLITVDVVCRAIPSPLAFRKYIEFRKEKMNGDQICDIKFRDKYYGYRYSNLSIYNRKGENIYHNGIETDEWLRAFFSGICNRPSCYGCVFKKRYRVSDITLWDCFDVHRFMPEADDNRGVTKVLIHSETGYRHFQKFCHKLKYKSIAPDILVAGVYEMIGAVKQNENRDDFFRDMALLTGRELFEKYFPVGVSARFEKTVRIMAMKLGIYNVIWKAYKSIFGNKKR